MLQRPRQLSNLLRVSAEMSQERIVVAALLLIATQLSVSLRAEAKSQGEVLLVLLLLHIIKGGSFSCIALKVWCLHHQSNGSLQVEWCVFCCRLLDNHVLATLIIIIVLL